MLSQEEVIDRTNTTIKMANVLGSSADEVSDYMTAIWNNFDDGSKSLEYYGDVITKLGAATASSAEEIAEGLSKFASIGNTVGLSYEYATSALATVVANTRQSADVVGTAFKTLFARIQDLELGDTLDDGTTLGTYSQALEKIGVNIKDNQGALRDMDDILNDIGAKWKTLSADTKVATAQAVAGTRQYSQMMALMDSWDDFQTNLNTANNSLGALNEQQEIYMESVEAHLQKMSTAAEETYDILFDTKAVNSMTDAVTGLIQVFNTFLKGLGGGLNDFTYFGSVLMNVFNKQIGGAIERQIQNIQTMQNNLSKAELAANIRQQHAAKGDSVSEAQLNAEIEAADMAQPYTRSMTTEQAQELLELQQQIGQKAKEKAEYEEQYKKIATEVLGIQDTSNVTEETFISKMAQKETEIEKIQRGIQRTSDAVLDYNELIYEGVEADTREYQNLVELLQTQLEYMDDSIAKQEIANKLKNQEKLSQSDLNKLIAQREANIDKREADIETLSGGQDAYNESQAMGQYVNEAKKAYSDALEPIKQQQIISEGIKGISTLTTAWITLSGVIKTATDEEATAGEKAERIFSTLLVNLPMILMNLGSLKSILPTITIGVENLAIAMGAEGAAAGMGFSAAIAGILSVAWPFIAVAGTIAAVSYGIAKAYNADSDAAKAAAKETENLKKAYDNAKTSSDTLKSTLEGYQDSLKNIESLTEGTTEFKQAIVEANDKALKLLETNKELAKYATRDSNGLITISDEGMDKVLEQQTQNMQKAQLAYMQSSLNSSRLQDVSDMTDFQRKYTYDNSKTGYQKSSSLGQYGQGNIDLYNRPIYKQPDGSISTVESVSFWSDEEQKEILVPLIQQIGDDVVEVTAETAQKIYEENGQYLGKFDNAAQANQYAAQLHEAQDYYYNLNNGDWSVTKQQVSKEILEDIADYMSSNSIEKLIPEDLAKIDSVAEANSSLQQSILDNIDAYSEMGVQLSQTKEKQRLLADECAAAYLELHGIKDEELKQDGNKEVVEHLFAQYLNNAEQKEEDIKDNTNQYIQDINKKYMDTAGVAAYSNGVTPGMIAGGLDTAKAYAKAMGYDENNIGHGGFLWKDYIFYNDQGEEQGRISSDDIASKYGEVLTNEAYQKAAEEAAKVVIKSVDDLINNKDLSNLDSYDATLSQLFKSGESGQLTAKSSIMSQQQAKDLLNEDTFNTLAEQINNSDFWQRQGFESAEQYIEAFKSWLQDRSNVSDVTALGDKAIISMNETSENVIDSYNKGDLTTATADNNEDYKQMVTYAKELKELYPELTAAADMFNNKNLIGTQEWTEALYQLEDKINELNLNRLVETADKAYDKLQEDVDKFRDENGEIDIEALLDSDNFMTDLDALMDADYAVNVEIHAQAEDAFESFESASKNLAEQAQKIGEKFIVSASDIRELNNAFPGIINGMKDVGDGTVQLSEKTVQSAMSAAQGELAASAQSTLGQLENQAKVLRSKQKIYQGMYEAANALAKGEGDLEENKATISKGFDELKAQNNKEVTEQEQSNAQLVATDSNTQAGIMASNWNEAYESAADSAIAFANTAVSANQVAQKGEGTVTKGNFGVNYKGQNGQSSEGAKLATLQETFDSGDADYAKMAESFKQAADALGSQANDIEGMIAQIGATTVEGSKGLQNVASGKGYSPSKSSKSGSDPDKMDQLEDEKDIYHDIDIILKQISTDLDRLQKQQDKLFGQDLINNLNKQLAKMDEQINASRKKIEIARGEASRLQGVLSQQGVGFNSDGTISNYESVYNSQLNYVNSLIAQYNSMSKEAQEKFKDVVEAAKKNFETLKDNIDKYDEVITETIPGLEDDIQDAIDQEIQINITKFDMEIEIRLDMAEAERDWNEFKKKVIDGIKDTDILGNAKAELQDFFSYYKESGEGIIQVNTKHVEDTLAELRQMDSTGWSQVYGDNRTAALEDLKKYNDQLMTDLESMVDLVDKIKESYLDMMDEAAEKFKDQLDLYSQISDLIEHDMNVIQLVYGDESYEKLAKYYEKQEDNFNNQLDFQRQQVDFWQKQMDTLEEGSDEWKKAKEEWMSAVEEWNKTVEDAIKNLQDKYLNTINQIFQELNNKVTAGKGLDYVNEQWNLINKNAEQYLDSINSVYAVQQLQKKYQDAIDTTDNVTQQRKLKTLMDEQIKALQEKDKLTQYDVDRAELKYQIALKQIALEEAQQNKSTMRLRRDSQGNYSYQYTADNDEINSIQQEVSDLYNKLYNMDIDKYKDNLDQIYSVWEEFQEKMAEAAQINDPEARAEKELLLKEQYGELINGLVEQNEDIRNNIYESTFLELADLYDTDYAAFATLTKDKQDLLVGDMIPQWNSGVQQMADAFAGEDGFYGVCKDAFEKLDNATKDYEGSLKNLQDSAGQDFNEIGSGLDNVINQTQNLLSGNRELINSYIDQLNAVRSVINELEALVAEYKNAETAAKAATAAAYGYWQAQQRQAANAASNQYNGGNSNSNNSNTRANNNSGSGEGSGSGKGDGILSVGDTATFSGKYYYDSFGTTPAGSRYSGVANGIVIDRVNNNPYGIHIHSADGKFGDLGWIKRSQLTGYDTGGYTGNWGDNSGRLALLHKKELVLNSEDTENMLNMLKIMRGVTQSIDSNMLSRMAEMFSGTSVTNMGVAAGNDTLEQNVHIEANFPNVTKSDEIEKAIHNLNNIASQRINRNRG